MSEIKKPDFELYSIECRYISDSDTESPTPGVLNEITLSMEGICYDMGYIVFKTDRWAINDADEFVKLLKDFESKCLNNLHTNK